MSQGLSSCVVIYKALWLQKLLKHEKQRSLLGLLTDSGEGTSEQLDVTRVRKRARTCQRQQQPHGSLSLTPLFSVLMDKVEEMDRHDAAAERPRGEPYSSAMSAIVPCILCPPQVDMKARQGPWTAVITAAGL